LCFINTCLGNERYGEIQFSGTIFVNEMGENGNYVGFVFGYQSNRKFYLVSWRHNNQNYQETTYKAGLAGIQIKVNTLCT